MIEEENEKRVRAFYEATVPGHTSRVAARSPSAARRLRYAGRDAHGLRPF